MPELVTKSGAQEEPRKKTEGRTAAGRIAGSTVVAVLVILVATMLYAQDKYTLTSPGGIAFSDFRGYEDWPVVSSARTDEVLKVIVANPAMIKAYKAGVSRQRPDLSGGLDDRKAAVGAEEEHRGAIRCGCARRLQAGFRHGEGQQEVSQDRRMGVRGV
ncbi:MAG TPA: hypothetical protein VJP02_20785 [Candidatus Sulfotelmatobacter sp.]|nr:hypothetical protein [Candidatus Sulfotelmatobacter sp.]